MATRVSPAITDLLGAGRVGLVERALAYTSRFACPVCGRYGDAACEQADAVLFYEIGMTGGYGGATIDAPPGPEEPTLLRWWLTRRHHDCDSAPVLPWSALPPPGPCLAGVSAGRPTDRWSADLAPVGPGMAVLRWQRAVPIAHVVHVPRGSGGGERLVDVLIESMLERGARVLSPSALVLDDLTAVPRLSDWYCQVSGPQTVTVWMAPTFHDRVKHRTLPEMLESLRRPLCVVEGLPASWVAEVRAQRQMLLLTTPPVVETGPPTITGLDQSQRSAFRVRMPQTVGGIVHAGDLPDRERAAAPIRHAPPPSTRAPAIEVTSLWEAALLRAGTLVRAYRDEFPTTISRRLTVPPEVLLGLVVTALCREQDIDPARVSVAEIAHRLAYPDRLRGWLTMLLAPTSIAGQLEEACRVEAPPRVDDRYLWAWAELAEQARTPVERQWLIDTGGIRLGDRVRIIPAAGSGDQSVARATVYGVLPSARPLPEPSDTPAARVFTVSTDPHGRRLTATGFDLLLDDDTDPRALPHAAAIAALDLRRWQPETDQSGIRRSLARTALREHATHHTISAVRHILDRLADAPDDAYPAAISVALGHLQRLTARREATDR